MGQVTIYLDDAHEKQMRIAARAAGLPVSRWLAKLVEEKTRNGWPESVTALAGAWPDFPEPEQLRASQPLDKRRARL